MPEHSIAKSFGNYKMSFNTLFDNDNGDYIILKVSISPDLRLLIKSVTLDDQTEYTLPDGNGRVTPARYKAKRWLFSSLSPNNRDSLFNKELLDCGETQFKFVSVTYLDDFIRHLKTNTKLLIQTIHNYSEINATVTFNLEK